MICRLEESKISILFQSMSKRTCVLSHPAFPPKFSPIAPYPLRILHADGDGMVENENIPSTYLHNLILQFWQEEVDDLVLLDGERVQVDLLHGLDLALLHQTTELGNWLPFLLLILVCAPTRSTASTSTATVSSSVTSGTESTTSSSSSWCVSHDGIIILIEQGAPVRWSFRKGV